MSGLRLSGCFKFCNFIYVLQLKIKVLKETAIDERNYRSQQVSSPTCLMYIVYYIKENTKFLRLIRGKFTVKFKIKYYSKMLILQEDDC